MKTSEIRSVLEALNEEIQNLSESTHKLILSQLLNLVESSATEIEGLRQENQALRDENNRLKGEQGQPDIRPQTPNRVIFPRRKRGNPPITKRKNVDPRSQN